MSFLSSNYSKKSIYIYVECSVQNDPTPSDFDVVVEPTSSTFIVPVDVVVVHPTPSLPVEVPVQLIHEGIEEDSDGGEFTELSNFLC